MDLARNPTHLPKERNRVLITVDGISMDAGVVATKFGNERREDGSWAGIRGRQEYLCSALRLTR